MNGPFEIELKLRFTDNGTRTAVATYGFPTGVYPTPESTKAAIEGTVKKVQEELGAEWRLQTREEFTNDIIHERSGTELRFATETEWDVA